jgi:hypothetical protein
MKAVHRPTVWPIAVLAVWQDLPEGTLGFEGDRAMGRGADNGSASRMDHLLFAA